MKKNVPTRVSFAERHKDVLLVSLAYLIGFTTAFIAFAVAGDESFKGEHKSYSNQASVVNRTTEEVGVKVVEKPEGLFMERNGKERVLSATTSVFPASVGHHSQIVTSEVSPSGSYIHYCAETDPAARECQHLVYSVEEDKVYRLKNSEGALESQNTAASSVTWSMNDMLQAGNLLASSESGWVLR